MTEHDDEPTRPLRMDAPKIHELLALMQDVRERVRQAPPAWQSEWTEMEQDIANVRRAIEMSRWGHGRIDEQIDALQHRCQEFHSRLCQECPSVPPPSR